MNVPKLRKTTVLAVVGLAAAGVLQSRAARAEIEYQELEVYTHQMDGEGSVEVSNFTSFSDTNKGVDNVMRSSLEFEYGLTNNLQLAAYTDFSYDATNQLNFNKLRIRGRYSFFEQNQLPVDLGVYVELALPRGEDNKLEGEFRLIVSKDIERFTVSFNPTLERALIVTNDAPTDLQWGASASVAYRVDSHWLPHFDVFGALGAGEEGSAANQLMLVPAIDYRMSRGFMIGARAGFGMTDATERHLAAVRLEYEL